MHGYTHAYTALKLRFNAGKSAVKSEGRDEASSRPGGGAAVDALPQSDESESEDDFDMDLNPAASSSSGAAHRQSGKQSRDQNTAQGVSGAAQHQHENGQSVADAGKLPAQGIEKGMSQNGGAAKESSSSGACLYFMCVCMCVCMYVCMYVHACVFCVGRY